MRNKEERLEIITSHYQKWIETATDEYHKAYAQIMLDSIYNENYIETFQNLSKVEQFTQPKSRWKISPNLGVSLKKAG
jgi:hypothetical protein